MTSIRAAGIHSIWLLLLVSSGLAQSPTVQKVDPPNWFIGLSNPMVLIHGEHLNSAVVRAGYPGVRVARVKGQHTANSSDGGDYLFLWLDIESNARPGNARITITTPSGKTEFIFPITKRRPLSDGFRGFDGNDVLYLIMPDRFADGDPTNDSPLQAPNSYDRNDPRAYHGGDLRGITQHLDYLKDLGVTTIWTTPIYHNADDRLDYHGYGAVDLYAADEHLGDLEEYRHFVAAAHQRGMKVLLDLVPNHIGPTHPWVNDPPDTEWLHGTRQNHLRAEGDFAPITDPHALYPEWRAAVEGWFANILPDMNTENPLTKQYLIQNAMWWAEETALDGFRLDTFPYVGRQFWHDFHLAMHSAYPSLKTVGECFSGDATIVSYFAGGVAREGIDTGLDTPFDFPVFFALRDTVLGNAPMSRLADTLRLDWLYPHPERLVPFEGNHDVSRFLTEAKGDVEKLKLAFSILFTIRGTPQMYYGDEIGMEGRGDPDNRRDFPGGFPGDQHDAFTQTGRTPQEQDIFHHVQMLLRLRSQHPALRIGDLKDIFVDQSAYVYTRQGGGETVLIAINNSDQLRAIKLPTFFSGVLIPVSERAPDAHMTATGMQMELPARKAAIYLVH
jgi:neopullulanase